MKLFIRTMMASILMIMVAPAWSANVLHAVHCQQDDETSDEQIEAISAEWLKAVKTVKGGENMKLRLNFPIAAKMGETDVVMLVVAPSFAEWGLFMDNYPGSAAEAIDEKYEGEIDCVDGSLWETVLLK